MYYDVKVIKGTVFDGSKEYSEGDIIGSLDDDTYERLCLGENPCCEMVSCVDELEPKADDPKKPDAPPSKKPEAKEKPKRGGKSHKEEAPDTNMPE